MGRMIPSATTQTEATEPPYVGEDTTWIVERAGGSRTRGETAGPCGPAETRGLRAYSVRIPVRKALKLLPVVTLEVPVRLADVVPPLDGSPSLPVVVVPLSPRFDNAVV